MITMKQPTPTETERLSNRQEEETECPTDIRKHSSSTAV